MCIVDGYWKVFVENKNGTMPSEHFLYMHFTCKQEKNPYSVSSSELTGSSNSAFI